MPRNLSVLSLNSMDSDVLYIIQKKCRIIESKKWEGRDFRNLAHSPHLFVNPPLYSVPQNWPSSYNFKKNIFFFKK